MPKKDDVTGREFGELVVAVKFLGEKLDKLENSVSIGFLHVTEQIEPINTTVAYHKFVLNILIFFVSTLSVGFIGAVFSVVTNFIK